MVKRELIPVIQIPIRTLKRIHQAKRIDEVVQIATRIDISLSQLSVLRLSFGFWWFFPGNRRWKHSFLLFFRRFFHIIVDWSDIYDSWSCFNSFCWVWDDFNIVWIIILNSLRFYFFLRRHLGSPFRLKILLQFCNILWKDAIPYFFSMDYTGNMLNQNYSTSR